MGILQKKCRTTGEAVLEAQILVVQGLLCGNSSEKVPYYRGKGPGAQGKRWPKYRYCFLALRLGVVLYLLRWALANLASSKAPFSLPPDGETMLKEASKLPNQLL